MATPDDIENRLAAGADRDVSEVRAELRAHTSALNALRTSQVEMAQKLDGLGHTTTRGFAAMSAGMAQILSRLDDLTDQET